MLRIDSTGLAGLVASLTLLKNGIPVRIIDKRDKHHFGLRGSGIQVSELMLARCRIDSTLSRLQIWNGYSSQSFDNLPILEVKFPDLSLASLNESKVGFLLKTPWLAQSEHDTFFGLVGVMSSTCRVVHVALGTITHSHTRSAIEVTFLPSLVSGISKPL